MKIRLVMVPNSAHYKGRKYGFSDIIFHSYNVHFAISYAHKTILIKQFTSGLCLK